MAEEKVIYTMDLFTEQTPDQNQLYPFYENLHEGRFSATKCKECGALPWPPRTVCPECMSDQMEWTDLPTKGKITIFSAEEIGVPAGFDIPLLHALVDIEGGPRGLFTRITKAKVEDLKVGMEVELDVIPISRGRVIFGFKPVGA